MLFAEVQEGRENSKAFLALKRDSAWHILVRLEFYGNH
jgi:hypothetical protein